MTKKKKEVLCPLLRLSFLSAVVETNLSLNSQMCKTGWKPRVLLNRNEMLSRPHAFLINICGDGGGGGGVN